MCTGHCLLQLCLLIHSPSVIDVGKKDHDQIRHSERKQAVSPGQEDVYLCNNVYLCKQACTFNLPSVHLNGNGISLLSYTPFSLDINMYILLKVLHMTLIVLREFVQISRNFLRVRIISFILFTCTFDLAMILFGEI